MIVENERGTRLLAFHPVPESEIAGRFPTLAHANVVAKHRDGFLIVRHRLRGSWEVPAGTIERGESPRECATRELKEETNQEGGRWRFLGVLKFQYPPDDRIEYDALYACDIGTVNEFQANEEIGEIKFWDDRKALLIDPIDRKIIEYGLHFHGGTPEGEERRCSRP
jgi:8-oxo-dGTP diphosphatase